MNALPAPKVQCVRSVVPLSNSEAFRMICRFLTAEQQKQDAVTLQQSHWEELYHVTETLVDRVEEATTSESGSSAAAERETLRQLRLTVAPQSSPGGINSMIYDQTPETRPRSDSNLIPVDHTSSIKMEAHNAEKDTMQEKSEKKSLKREKKAAKKEKKKARKIKR